MKKESLVGTWKLVSSERHAENGEIIYPFGRDAIGQLMYDDKGFMSVNVTSKNRPGFSYYEGAPEEIKAAFESYLAYFGTYTVDEAKNEVVHHIVGHLQPHVIGTDILRYVEFSGKRLILRGPPTKYDRRTMVPQVTWERP